MLIKDANLTIMVADINKSISFYQSLGFDLKNRWGDHYAQLTSPGIVIGLHPYQGELGGSGNTSIGFTTDNFDEVKKVLARLAIKVEIRNEEGGQFLHFTDPDGTMLYFIRPKGI